MMSERALPTHTGARTEASRPRSTAWFGAVVRLARPRQWIKNLLVLIVPLGAGRLDEPDVLLGALVAFVVFCAMASSVYMLNDVRDIAEDQAHPSKCHRPVAAGEVSPQMATTVAIVLALCGVAGASFWSVPLALTLAVYLVAQVAYSCGLKHQPVMDLAVVASGFLLRTVAGSAATAIDVSATLLIVATFGSLFMVAGKRYSELRKVGARGATRLCLVLYSESYLRFVWSTAACMTLVGYVLWSRSEGLGEVGSIPWGAVSMVPFVLAVLRYAVDVDRGTAGAPEDIVLGDRVLQVLGAAWLLTVLPAVIR